MWVYSLVVTPVQLKWISLCHAIQKKSKIPITFSSILHQKVAQISKENGMVMEFSSLTEISGQKFHPLTNKKRMNKQAQEMKRKAQVLSTLYLSPSFL